MGKIKKIALTGGPCGGKSEVLKVLAEKFAGQIVIVPEMATTLLSVPYAEGGPGVPGKDIEWSQEWQDNFQKMIVQKQLEAEAAARAYAETLPGNIIIVCDRGVLDGAAYSEGTREEFLEQHGITMEECKSLYDHVIHLYSLAVDDPEIYKELVSTNPVRFESLEQAAVLDAKILKAWEGFYRSAIGGCESFEEKGNCCISIVELFLGMMREEEELEKETRPNEIPIR